MYALFWRRIWSYSASVLKLALSKAKFKKARVWWHGYYLVRITIRQSREFEKCAVQPEDKRK